jgi:hypothetical protein
LNGTYFLLSPPPGPAFAENSDRRFILEFANPTDWSTVSAVVARRQKLDSDLWAIEIEDRTQFGGLTPEK